MRICIKETKELTVIPGNIYIKEGNQFFIGMTNGDLISLQDGCCWNIGGGFGKISNPITYYGWRDVTEEYCIAPIDKD